MPRHAMIGTQVLVPIQSAKNQMALYDVDVRIYRKTMPRYRVSYMRVHILSVQVLLNVLNKLSKRDEMGGFAKLFIAVLQRV